MASLVTFDSLTPTKSILSCVILAIIYVSSLYVWKNSTDRDDPQVIKKRFISVLSVTILSPAYVWCWSTRANLTEGYTLATWLGLRYDNIIPAIVLPLLLIMILFLGPLLLIICVDPTSLLHDFKDMANRIFDIYWLRSHIIAPFTEEFVFRACMLPILFTQFGRSTAIFICPLMFGLAHLHHLIEKIIKKEQSLGSAIAVTVFQCGFTTVFGWYTSFVFLRTGHIIGPIICHAFCNSMGFPSFSDIGYCKYPKLIWTAYIAGLLMFFILLFPMTDPKYFGGLYWSNVNN